MQHNIDTGVRSLHTVRHIHYTVNTKLRTIADLFHHEAKLDVYREYCVNCNRLPLTS